MRMHGLLSVCSLALVFALGTSSTTLANTYNLGTLTPTNPLSISVIAPPGAVNDNLTFGFTVANGPLSVYAELVNGYTENGKHQLATGLLSFGNSSSYIELFRGSPVGTPVAGSYQELVHNGSSDTVTGTTQTFTLTPGSYYLEVVASAPGKAGPPALATGGADFTVGIFGSAVPEPATWATLILGVAMIGFVARRRSGAAALAG